MRKYFFILLCGLTILNYAETDKIILAADPLIIPSDSVVASVGSINISLDEFKNGYDFGPAFYKRVKNSKEVYLDYLINEKLIVLDAIENGLDTTQGVKKIYKSFLDDIATEEMFKDSILSKVKYTQDEIDTVAKQKIIDVSLQWLYTPDEKKMYEWFTALKNGASYDSIYNTQFNESVWKDDRSLESNRYQIGKKNPILGKIIDTLSVGNYTAPIKVGDGWYIVKMKNFDKKIIVSETEQNKILNEARDAVIKAKIDILSDKFVRKIMERNNPIIKGEAFAVLRSYLGKYELKSDKYNKWNLERKLEEALNKAGINEKYEINKMPLIITDNKLITLNEFLTWYSTRSQYLKFNKKSFNTFSASLEQIIWRMVRDNLLSEIAYRNGYYNRPNVMKQAEWWRHKILYSTAKNEMLNSIFIENPEVRKNYLPEDTSSEKEYVTKELTKKMLRKILELKRKYKITVNKNALDGVLVNDENDSHAIDFYTVKRGGLIPRIPYPSIDNYWKSWE